MRRSVRHMSHRGIFKLLSAGFGAGLVGPSETLPQTCADQSVAGCSPGEVQAAKAAQSTTTTTPKAPPLTTDEAINLALNSSMVRYNRVDRVAAKVVLFKELRQRATPAELWSIADRDEAVVVAVSGDATSYAGVSITGANGTTEFSWTALAYNQQTHELMLFDAGSGAWPPYFDQLPTLQ